MSDIRSAKDQHNQDIQEYLRQWESKPLLQEVYMLFYQEIFRYLRTDITGDTVELGSGIGNLKRAIPNVVTTDIFPNTWIDRVENAYALTYAPQSVAHLILFDVFHHLEFPGTALAEFLRVLKPGGRVIIFDPAVSLLGFLVYGLCHPEPIGWSKPITWQEPRGFDPYAAAYYAAQGNSARIFFSDAYAKDLQSWRFVIKKRMSAISYVAAGGYRAPQMYPMSFLGAMRWVDRLCDQFPALFATRLLVVLEKP